MVNNKSICQQTQTITVNVYPVLNPGAAGYDQTICSGNTPAPFTSSAVASGGKGTIAYQWQSRTYDGSAWSNWVAAAGANNQAAYSPGALTQRTQYRRCATNTFTACSDTTDIQIAAAMSAGAIGDAQTICYNTIPSQLISTTKPNGGTGTNIYIWEQSATGTSGWVNVSGATSVSYTPPNLTTTTHYRRIRSNDCGSDTSNTVKITVRNQSLYNYPDIRVRICPDAGTSINMSKYIDTLDLNGVPQWQSLSSVPITPDGVILTNNLNTSSQVYTFTYTVSNPCLPEGVVRKVYLEVLKAGSMRPLRDTITICFDNAEAVNINQIFGIDAGFDDNIWSYKSWSAGDVDKHVTRSKSSTYYGAVVMNGKAIYNDNAIARIPDTNNKKVVFTCKPKAGGCLSEKSYMIVIILTGS
jgi:hypothetical protein